MIRGLAISGRAAGRARPYRGGDPGRSTSCARTAGATAELLAAWKDGRARFPAYLDDHAFLLDALLELLQARWRSADLDFARALADRAARALRRTASAAASGSPRRARIRRSRRLAELRRRGHALRQRRRRAGARASRLAARRDALSRCRRGDAQRRLRIARTRAPPAHTALLNALDECLEPGRDHRDPRCRGQRMGRGAGAALRAATHGLRDSSRRRGAAPGAGRASARAGTVA